LIPLVGKRYLGKTMLSRIRCAFAVMLARTCVSFGDSPERIFVFGTAANFPNEGVNGRM
jgi:hypothetical protein